MSESMVRTRRWTRAEYDKLIDAGFFGPGDKIELLAGQLCVSELQNSPHARGIWLGQEALQKALRQAGAYSRSCRLRSMTSPHLSRISRWFQAVHATTRIIRRVPRLWRRSATRPWRSIARTGRLYARARLSEYWIVNLADRMLEVHRNPCPDNRAPCGWAYSVMLTLGSSEHIVPLVAPSARILIADLLP
jgi:hypothetical protein